MMSDILWIQNVKRISQARTRCGLAPLRIQGVSRELIRLIVHAEVP